MLMLYKKKGKKRKLKLKALRDVEKSQTLFINEQSRSLEAEGQKVYKFGFGQNPFEPPAIMQKTLAKNAHQALYVPVGGIPELRTEISKFYKKKYKMSVSPDNVLVGPGSKQLMLNIMMAFEKANVFVPGPSWVSYAPQARLAGHNVLCVETDYDKRWRMTYESLHRAIKGAEKGVQNILVLNYPDNPCGLQYSKDELEALVPLLRSNGFLVISDEIYSMLDYNKSHSSIANLYPEGTIVTSGLSKMLGAGGWRLGYCLVPESDDDGLRDALLGMGSETYSCAAAPIQYAAIEAFKYGKEIKEYIAQETRILKTIGQLSYGILKEGGVNVHAPEGGFYLFLDFSPFREKLAKRGIKTSDDLCDKILKETGAAILTASAFNMPAEALAARYSYVDFDGVTALKDAMKTPASKPLSKAFIKKHFAHGLEGTRKIVDFLND